MSDIELYNKHRPRDFKGLVGQSEAVATLAALGKSRTMPHALLFTGPSGCGKTTIARILRVKIGCGDADFREINSADARGIDDVRLLDRNMRLSPMAGSAKVYLIDEAHKMTNDAQNAMLKMLEDTPSHVYFFLASSEPAKLIKAIKTRCTEIKVKPVPADLMKKLVQDTANTEGKPVGDAVAAKIAEVSQGSPRKALVLLHQVIGLPNDEAKLKAVERPDAEALGFEVAQGLLKKTSWSAINEKLRILEEKEEEPEAIRRIVLGYMKSVLSKSDNKRAFDILMCFREPTYDMGWPAVYANCYEACCLV